MNKHLENVHCLDSAQIACQIKETLARRLGQSNTAWQTSLVSRQASHGGTLVFSAFSPQTGQKVAAKVYLRKHLAEAEFQAAQELQSGQAAIAKVLFADAQIGLIVTDWQTGKNFSDLIENGDGIDAVTKAGAWLFKLHSTRQGRVRIYHPMKFLVDLCITANAMSGAILPRERNEFAQALSTTARKAAMTLPGIFTPVRSHGDFLPQNLILNPSGTVAIDFLHTRIESRYDDLASMTVNLALRAKIGTLGKSLSAEMARSAFLSAYGLRGRRAHSRLQLAERVELLKRWQYFANEIFPNRENGLAMVQAIQLIFHEQGWYKK